MVLTHVHLYMKYYHASNKCTLINAYVDTSIKLQMNALNS